VNNRTEILVVCIKVGAKYGAEYVNNLESMLRRHTTRDFDMICLTDDPNNIKCATAPIDTDLPGWWAKLVLFKPHPAVANRHIIYIDLDTVIVKNVDCLFRSRPRAFVIIKDWWANLYNSSLMYIPIAYGGPIYKDFIINPGYLMSRHNGDQDWISLRVQKPNIWQMVEPGLVGSYKANYLEDGPKDYSIICFHGEPKPHEVKDGWVADAWR
jgi:hypothetical protein